MNKILMLGLLLTSTVHANCGYLEIKIINDSSHNCTLKNKIIYHGLLPEGAAPLTIPAKESSPFFLASQDYEGVGVLLTYNCDKEIVKFLSSQGYCSVLGAGKITGMPFHSSTLSLSYEVKRGSSSEGGRAGRIIWRIS